MTQIQLGWSLPMRPRGELTSEEFLRDVQRGLDIVGDHFDSAWMTDHLQFDASPLLEGWTALTYMAALEPRLKFGHAVLCQSFRNPALLAKMAATFQYLSNGRFLLGLGAGWKEDEYRAYGYDYPSAGQRVKELEEALQIVNALWRDERASFQGTYYSVADARCMPKPDPLPPLVIGGTKPRMLRLVARYADWWNVSATALNQYRELVPQCEQACAEVGRDPSTLRRTWFGSCVCAPSEKEAGELVQGRLSDASGLVGTPAQVIEQMRGYIDLGVDYFMLNCGGFPRLTTLEMLVNEVLPALNA